MLSKRLMNERGTDEIHEGSPLEQDWSIKVEQFFEHLKLQEITARKLLKDLLITVSLVRS